MSSDPWQFLKTGEYSKAVEVYSELIVNNPKSRWYRGRASAFLGMRMLEDALRDFESAEQMSPFPGDGYRQWIATTQWLMGDYMIALDSWRSLVNDFSKRKIKYTDASGGLHNGCLLWFAAVSTDSADDVSLATESMKELLFNPLAKNWPGAVAAFLCCQIDEPRLRSYVSEVDILRQREECQASFYAAITSRLNSNSGRCQQLLNEAVQDPIAKIECEFYLANHEAKRISY